MALALFDLDNTLLNGDSDHGWGMYLAQIGAVDPVEQKQQQDYFYQQYVDGKLDIFEFCEFQFKVLAETPLAKLKEWRATYLNEIIEPMILNGKASLLDKHRSAGDEIIIITATNDFVTGPIAQRLGVKNLIATTAEFKNGKYTGKVSGTPCFQAGKITRLKQWLSENTTEPNESSFSGSTFYSDSINDLPLMELVETAIAVTPDDRLRAHAKQQQWQIID